MMMNKMNKKVNKKMKISISMMKIIDYYLKKLNNQNKFISKS